MIKITPRVEQENGLFSKFTSYNIKQNENGIF